MADATKEAPNWFYYWKQTPWNTLGIPVPDSQPTRFSSVLSSPEYTGEFDPANPNRVLIGSVAGSHERIFLPPDAPQPIIRCAGINLFAAVLFHEWQHLLNYRQSHPDRGVAQDSDGDWLVDTLEGTEDWNHNGVLDCEQVQRRTELAAPPANMTNILVERRGDQTRYFHVDKWIDGGIERHTRQGRLTNGEERKKQQPGTDSQAQHGVEGVWDTEDANRNGVLDDTPGPTVLGYTIADASAPFHDNSRPVRPGYRDDGRLVYGSGTHWMSRWDDEHDLAWATMEAVRPRIGAQAWIILRRYDWANPGYNHDDSDDATD